VKVFRSFRGLLRSQNVGKPSHLGAAVARKKKNSLNSVAAKASKLIETSVLMCFFRVVLVRTIPNNEIVSLYTALYYSNLKP